MGVTPEPSRSDRRVTIQSQHMDACVRAHVLRQTAAYLQDEASALLATTRTTRKLARRARRWKREGGEVTGPRPAGHLGHPMGPRGNQVALESGWRTAENGVGSARGTTASPYRLR